MAQTVIHKRAVDPSPTTALTAPKIKTSLRFTIVTIKEILNVKKRQ